MLNETCLTGIVNAQVLAQVPAKCLQSAYKCNAQVMLKAARTLPPPYPPLALCIGLHSNHALHCRTFRWRYKPEMHVHAEIFSLLKS